MTTDRYIEPLWERMCSGIDHGSCAMPVRPCDGSDIEKLASLAHAAFEDTVDHEPLELWTGKISSIINGKYGTFLPTASFMADATAGQLAGVVLATNFLFYQGPVIALIAVHPCAQGAGLGTYLLRSCVNALSVEGFTVCRARISPGNDVSKRLFQRNAFVLRELWVG